MLPQLPAKRHDTVPVLLSNEHEYRLAERDVIAWLQTLPLDLRTLDAKVAAALRAEQLVRLNNLRQLAASGKLPTALAWIADFLESGEPIVVFAEHIATQKAVLERFPKALHILGSDSAEARQRAVDAFQDPDGPQLIVCSLKAASQGITLTRASNVAFLELDWTPARHDQAEDRLHRIGQDSAVTAWYLLAPDTIDETMAELLERKRSLIDAVTDGQVRDEERLVDAVARELRGPPVPASARGRLAAMPPATAAELVAELVSIDSVNPDLVPGGAGEAEVAAYVADWLRDAGLDVEVDEAAPGRHSVVGVARGTGGGRSLMLNGHIDTVGVDGMERPFEPVVRDGRLYARGGYDMKAGVAACMLAAKRVASEELAGDVIVTAVADEEYASIGTQSVLERWRADAAIVTEPTALRVCVAHKGFVWAELETTGRAAHGSRPAEGVDAIARMAPALSRLADLQAELDGRPGHELVGPGLGARVPDRGRAGAVELPRALRALARAPHRARGERRTTSSASAARSWTGSRARRCGWGSCGRRSASIPAPRWCAP